MRKAWELTQSELMVLLGGKSGGNLSRIEWAGRWPSAHALIASTIIFGRSIEHLFKSLYDAVEDHVLREAYLLDERLAGDDQPKSKHKRKLLAQVIQSIIDRHSQKGV